MTLYLSNLLNTRKSAHYSLHETAIKFRRTCLNISLPSKPYEFGQPCLQKYTNQRINHYKGKKHINNLFGQTEVQSSFFSVQAKEGEGGKERENISWKSSILIIQKSKLCKRLRAVLGLGVDPLKSHFVAPILTNPLRV